MAQLPRTVPFPAADYLDDPASSPYRRDVKVWEAFAHLAAGEHDVVAVAGNPKTTKDGAKVWDLVLTVNALRVEGGGKSLGIHPRIDSLSEQDLQSLDPYDTMVKLGAER